MYDENDNFYDAEGKWKLKPYTHRNKKMLHIFFYKQVWKAL